MSDLENDHAERFKNLLVLTHTERVPTIQYGQRNLLHLMKSLVEDAISHTYDFYSQGTPTDILFLNGASGSGKTTLGELIIEYLQTLHFKVGHTSWDEAIITACEYGDIAAPDQRFSDEDRKGINNRLLENFARVSQGNQIVIVTAPISHAAVIDNYTLGLNLGIQAEQDICMNTDARCYAAHLIPGLYLQILQNLKSGGADTEREFGDVVLHGAHPRHINRLKSYEAASAQLMASLPPTPEFTPINTEEIDELYGELIEYIHDVYKVPHNLARFYISHALNPSSLHALHLTKNILQIPSSNSAILYNNPFP